MWSIAIAVGSMLLLMGIVLYKGGPALERRSTWRKLQKEHNRVLTEIMERLAKNEDLGELSKELCEIQQQQLELM